MWRTSIWLNHKIVLLDKRCELLLFMLFSAISFNAHFDSGFKQDNKSMKLKTSAHHNTNWGKNDDSMFLLLLMIYFCLHLNYPKLVPIRVVLYEKKSEILKNFLKSVQIIEIFNLVHLKIWNSDIVLYALIQGIFPTEMLLPFKWSYSWNALDLYLLCFIKWSFY